MVAIAYKSGIYSYLAIGDNQKISLNCRNPL